MRKYTIGDYFVLRSDNDLKLAAKKLEVDGYQVYADGSQAAREHVKHVATYLMAKDGLAAIGIDNDEDIVVSALGFFSRTYAKLYFGGFKPKERPLVG